MPILRQPHLVVIEDWHGKVWQLAFRHLVLPIKIPWLGHELHQLRVAFEHLIVDRDGACPAAQAALLGLLQAKQAYRRNIIRHSSFSHIVWN